MSASKFKYYTVNIEMLVKANSQRDAIAIAFGEDEIPGETLEQEITAQRVLAGELETT